MRPAGKAGRTRTSDVYPEYKLPALRRRDGYPTDLLLQSFIKHNVRQRTMLRGRKTTMKMEDPRHVGYTVNTASRAHSQRCMTDAMVGCKLVFCRSPTLVPLSSSSKYHCSSRI